MGRALGIALKVPGLRVSGLDPVTAAYAANIATAGGSISAASLAANDQLVRNLKAANVWDKLHEIYTFSGDFAAALVKLKTVTGQITLTNNNFVSGDFAENAGLTGNGSSKYLQTGYIPSTHGTTNSTSMGVWNHAASAAGGAVHIGAVTGSNASRQAMNAPFTDGRFYFDAYDVTTGRTSSGVLATPYGLLVGSRRGATDAEIYRNGASLATSSSGGGTKPSHELFMFALNISGSPSSHVSHRMSFGLVGLGLTDADVLSLYLSALVFQQTMVRV
jgi:hypothetical protein